MANWSKLLIIFMGVLLLFGLGAAKQFGGWNPADKPDQEKDSPEDLMADMPTDPSAAGSAPAEEQGPEDAPVVLTVYHSSEIGCHNDMLIIARELIAGNTQDIRLRLVNTTQPAGVDECKKVVGCDVGGMAVNGQANWLIAQGKREANPVQFYGACEHSGRYGQADVKAALVYALRKAGREPSKDLTSTDSRVVEGKTEPGKTEPEKTEPGKTEPGKTDP